MGLAASRDLRALRRRLRQAEAQDYAEMLYDRPGDASVGRIFRRRAAAQLRNRAHLRQLCAQIHNCVRSEVRIAGAELTDFDVSVLGYFLSTGMLESVRIQGGAICDEGCEAIARGLPNMFLTGRLELSRSLIAEAGARALSLALRASPHLRELRLDGNRLGPIGACAIAAALAEGCALTHLSIDGDRSVGDRGAFAFAKALRVNTALVSLSLQDTGITAAGALALADALLENAKLEALSLEDNVLPLEEVIGAMERVVTNSGVPSRTIFLTSDVRVAAAQPTTT